MKGHELDPDNPELLYWLADFYCQGYGVLENEEKAVALYQQAADMGHARAQTAIGDAHAQCDLPAYQRMQSKRPSGTKPRRNRVRNKRCA